MHFQYLLEKGNKALKTSDGVTAARAKFNGELVLGLRLPAGEKSRVVVFGASEYSHIQCGLDDIGLVASVNGGALLGSKQEALRLSFVNGDDRVTRETIIVDSHPTPVLAPNLMDLSDPFQTADLVIEADRPGASIFLGSSRRVDREPLYRLARGAGVEIGPGPKPQILNGPTVSVLYVEEKHADDWLSTYKTNASGDVWDGANYRIGKAHDLPVEDGSLDFIFSSHVVEHLYNPLGHFDHWRSKLKSGGLVLAVIPASDGTKDFVFPPTSILDLVEEHKSGQYAAPISAYRRWVRALQPHHNDPDAVADQYFADKFSIHVHVYDFITINNLLRRCVQSHGYSGYRVYYKRNSKDFLVALKAA